MCLADYQPGHVYLACVRPPTDPMYPTPRAGIPDPASGTGVQEEGRAIDVDLCAFRLCGVLQELVVHEKILYLTVDYQVDDT